MSSHSRDNGPQTFWGHDLDLSRSRDVIDHVTSRFPISHLLLVVHWYQVSISTRVRDIRVQKPVRTRRNTHAHTHTASDFIFCPMRGGKGREGREGRGGERGERGPGGGTGAPPPRLVCDGIRTKAHTDKSP